MEEVFEPVTVKQAEATKNQKQISEKQIQAIGQQIQTIEIRQEQNNTPAKYYKSQSNREYKNVIKLLTVKINLLQILLIQTKLILV